MSSRTSLSNKSPVNPGRSSEMKGPGSAKRKTGERLRRVSFKGSDKRGASMTAIASKKRSSLAKDSNDETKHVEIFREILRKKRSSRNLDSPVSDSATHSSNSTSSSRGQTTPDGERKKVRSAKNFDDANGMDVSLHHNNLPACVIAVANRMKEAAVKRTQDQTRDELNSVMHRIKMALHHSGNDFSEVDYQKGVTSKEIIVFGLPDMDIEREREKRDARQKLVNFFTTSIKRSKSKTDLIQDIYDWFEQLKEVDDVDEKEMQKQKERQDEINAIHKSITASMSKVKKSSKQLKKIAKQIMAAKMLSAGVKEKIDGKEAGGEGKANDKTSTEKRMITAQELADKKNWPVAIKRMTLDLDEAFRGVHQEASRKNIQHVLKQFKLFGAVMESKLKEFGDIERRLSEKTTELQKALSDGERMQEKIKLHANGIQGLEEENELLQSKIADLEGRIEAETNTKIKSKTRERRRSILLPTGEGLTKPNSSITEEKKQDAEEQILNGSIAEQIKSRLGVITTESEENKDSNHDKKDQQEFRTTRRHTLATGQLHDVKELAKNKRTLSTVAKVENIPEEVPLENKIEKGGKDDVNKTVIKTLENTIDSLRTELAKTRTDIENQALRIIELETELTGKEALEQYIEQVEIEKNELNKELKASLTAYEKELEMRQTKADNLTDSIEELKNNMLIKEDQVAHLQRCLDTMTSDMQILLDEKIALENRQVNQVVKIELADSVSKQQMLIKLKMQYENELQRLRDFLAKEHRRYLAEIRRNATQHLNDIHTIHNGSTQLLKTVNRFKESLAVILEREALNEAAFELRQIESLPVEPMFSSSTETKQMLSMVAYQATELLVSLENRLSKALLSRRLEVKEAATAKGFVVRDLEYQSEKLRKARETGAIQAEKLKNMEEINRDIANDHQELSGKYKALQKELLPYQQLIENHMILKKEFERVQQENRETMKRSTYHLNEVEKDRAQLKRVVESQQELISKLNTKQTASQPKNNNKRQQRHAQRTASMFYIAKTQQQKNLERLDRAFESDQITSETHEKTAEIIRKTMDLPRLRFVHLVQRYVAHNKMIMIKQVMKASLKKYKDNIRLSKYIADMELRIAEKTKRWEERKAELVDYRGTILLQMMEAFSSVKNETGLLLVEPLCKTAPKPALHHGKETKRFVLRHEKQTVMPLEARLLGKSIKPQTEERCTMWQQPDFEVENIEPITMPRLVDLDINKWRYSAKSFLVGDKKEMRKLEISKAKMDKIKKTYSNKLRLPPIASIFPEKPSQQDWLVEED